MCPEKSNFASRTFCYKCGVDRDWKPALQRNRRSNQQQGRGRPSATRSPLEIKQAKVIADLAQKLKGQTAPPPPPPFGTSSRQQRRQSMASQGTNRSASDDDADIGPSASVAASSGDSDADRRDMEQERAAQRRNLRTMEAMKLGTCPAMETAKDTIRTAIADLDKRIGEAMPHHRRSAAASAEVNRTHKIHLKAKDAYKAVKATYDDAQAKLRAAKEEVDATDTTYRLARDKLASTEAEAATPTGAAGDPVPPQGMPLTEDNMRWWEQFMGNQTQQSIDVLDRLRRAASFGKAKAKAQAKAAAAMPAPSVPGKKRASDVASVADSAQPGVTLALQDADADMSDGTALISAVLTKKSRTRKPSLTTSEKWSGGHHAGSSSCGPASRSQR